MVTLFSVATAVSFSSTNSQAGEKSSGKVDFNRDIRPIFSENCYACHGPDKNKRKAGLRLDIKEEAFKKQDSGDYAIVPKNIKKSKLLKLTSSQDEDDRMPPSKFGKRLTREQTTLLKRWVEQGAEWKAHWSYLPPERPLVPNVKNKRWPRTEIDYFVLEKLEKAGLLPSKEGEKTTLIRRATLDLTGLPPTLEEVDAFLSDSNTNAYEKVVDRLLDSPHYGERMAVTWLDAARYADTSGYHFDSPRFMWLWRDWVIKAFNQNKPFDEFTVEQIAGDLLPNATREQKIASGFHRNVMTNDEGGADPAEYLAKYIVDRVNTTATVWLGTTIGCAECHDHKYDRVTQKDFYQLYAFFHNVPESGLDGTRVENPKPRMMVATPEQEAKLTKLETAIPAAEKQVKTREAELPEAQRKWELEVLESASNTDAIKDPAGLLARFTFDETLEGQVRGENFTAHYKGSNAPVWGSGKIGRGLKLDGQGAYVEAAGIEFDFTNAFSWGCWTKFKDKGGALLSKMDDGANFRGFDLLIEEGKPTVHLVNKWPENAIKVTAKTALPKDVYQHVFAVYDGSRKAKGLKIYANGKELPLEVKEDKLSATITNGVPFHIGKRLSSLAYAGSIDDVRCYPRALSAAEVEALAHGPQLALALIPAEKRSADQAKELSVFYKENYAADFKKAEANAANLKKQKEALLKEIPNTMVMEELPKPRDTFLLVRGNFQATGEKVSANVPAFLPPLAPGLAPNRLGLAQWLVSSENPLPSRVTVNRLWAMFFGTGIVKTVNDFGSQGDWPTHPELLDWLATEFMRSHWDVKHMVKLMVMSATYRQSAAVTPKLLERDPYNRLLTRGPRVRLDAEFIRDNALAVSGLLNPKIGGESVKPYQPPGLWEVTDRNTDQSKGQDLYRRGLYVYWKRAVHYPSFATFDAPNREICTVQRPRTSTPLQSLVLMNDPVYVEAARAFAQRVMSEAGKSVTERLVYAFRLVLARPPSTRELEVLQRAYDEQIENYQENAKRASELLAVGESPKPQGDAVQLAAWTGVANVLLNLSETITK